MSDIVVTRTPSRATSPKSARAGFIARFQSLLEALVTASARQSNVGPLYYRFPMY